MKSILSKLPRTALLFGFSAVLLSACTLGDVSNEIQSDELTPAEIEMASQIIGQSLSDDNDGVFASVNDALTTVSSDGFMSQPHYKGHDDDHGNGRKEDYSGRGGERNFQYEYDPATGTHTLSFDREVNNRNFQKTLSAVLTYVFTDIDGEFIATPRIDQASIENIDFTANKTGTVMSQHRDSEFSRADTFAITGVSEATTILTIDGNHYGNGTYNGVRGNGDTFERSFVNRIRFLDIQVNKDTVAEYGNLEHGVTGTLTYEMDMYKNNKGDETTKSISGTIEMDGDGTALLRFKNLSKIFHVDLRSGFVTDNEIEMESMVAAVDTVNQTLTLRNNVLVITTDRTEIEGEDGLESLTDVSMAIAQGDTVYAEVEGYRDPMDQGQFIAEKIEFESNKSDDDSDNNSESDDNNNNENSDDD